MDKRIAEKFFGIKLDNSFEKVILTNIKPFYEAISKSAKVILENRGFYENKQIIIDGSTFRLIWLTPGNVIVDVLRVIEPVSKEVILMGLVGGLSKSVKRGDVVKPMSALSIDGEIFHLDCSGKGIVFQTDGLIKDKSFYEDLKKNGVDFVDMESNYLGTFGKENGISCRLIGLVSDLPITSPFYLDEFEDKNIISDKITNLIKLI